MEIITVYKTESFYMVSMLSYFNAKCNCYNLTSQNFKPMKYSVASAAKKPQKKKKWNEKTHNVESCPMCIS